MYDRILVPTDGSNGTAHVALQAIDLAEQYGSTIHVLSVVETDGGSILSGGGDRSTDRERRARRAVERIETMAAVHDLAVETAVREGNPAEEILAYADEIAADVIVAGTHGRSGVKRHLIGSVAERLVRHATCPVLTVRLPETDVTVEDEADAREIASSAIDSAGYAGTVTGVDHQESVWVVDAEAGDDSLVVYVDPITQRTSVVRRH